MTPLSSTGIRVPAHPQVSHLLLMIQAEYREMPCLSLTKPQMQKLWGIEAHVCDGLIDALVDARILRRRLDGAYVAL
jgi:hypothetical protein